MKLTALTIFALLLCAFTVSGQDGCSPTNNFFESLGGRSSDQTVKGSDGGKKLVMDDGFEKITLILGSIPDGSADFTLVNHDASPGEGEIAVTYFYYSGNAEETLELNESGDVAHVCVKDGRILVTWSAVSFQGKANGNITYKTACEMGSPM